MLEAVQENKIANLLNDIRIASASLKEVKKIYAKKLAPDFSLMNFLRNNERALSEYIQFLLNPKAEHAQETLYLKLFLQRFKLTQYDAQQAKNVGLEKKTSERRFIDIYLEFNQGLIGIENKPWARDQVNQLEDYAAFLEQQAAGKPWILLYIGNNEPAQESIKTERRQQLEQQGHYLQITFTELAQWLEEAALHTRPASVRILIEALIDYIKIRVNGEAKMSNNEKFKDVILSNHENLVSGFDVLNSMDAVKIHLLNEFESALKSELQDTKESDWSLVWNKNELNTKARYAQFGIKLHPEHQFFLCFEFFNANLNGLGLGIRQLDPVKEFDESSLEPITNCLKKHCESGKFENTIWPWYVPPSVNIFLKDDEHDWENKVEPWLRLTREASDSLPKRIIELAKKITEALQSDSLHDLMCGHVNKL